MTTDTTVTLREVNGWRVAASTFSMSSAHTRPSRPGMPKAGYVFEPFLRLAPLSQVDVRLSFHRPSTQVTMTSTVPEKPSGTSVLGARRIHGGA